MKRFVFIAVTTFTYQPVVLLLILSLSLSLSVCLSLSLSLSSVKFTKLLLTRKRRVYLVHLVLISLALGREGGGTCNRHLMSMLQLQRNQPGMR